MVVEDSGQSSAFFRSRVDSESSAGVMQIDEHPSLLRGNRFQRPFHHLAAVALRGAQHIARQAMGMNPHERRMVLHRKAHRILRNIPAYQSYMQLMIDVARIRYHPKLAV